MFACCIPGLRASTSGKLQTLSQLSPQARLSFFLEGLKGNREAGVAQAGPGPHCDPTWTSPRVCEKQGASHREGLPRKECMVRRCRRPGGLVMSTPQAEASWVGVKYRAYPLRELSQEPWRGSHAPGSMPPDRPMAILITELRSGGLSGGGQGDDHSTFPGEMQVRHAATRASESLGSLAAEGSGLG